MPEKEKPLTRENLQSRLAAYKRVYFLGEDKGYPDLGVFADQFIDNFVQTGESTPHLIFIEGPLGAGKSYAQRQLIGPYIEMRSREAGINPNLVIINWVETEEENKRVLSLIRRHTERGMIVPDENNKKFWQLLAGRLWFGKVPFEDSSDLYMETVKKLIYQKTVPDKPNPPEVLFDANIAIRQRIRNEVRAQSPYTIIVIDKPGTTAPADSQTEGRPDLFRDYGAGMVRDLKQGGLGFREEFWRNLPVGYIGLVPGPRMDLLIIARHMIQKAMRVRNKEEALKEANIVASVFGMPSFESWESLRKFPKGGSIEQVSKGRRATMFFENTRFRLENEQTTAPQEILEVLDGAMIMLGARNANFWKVINSFAQSEELKSILEDVRKVCEISGFNSAGAVFQNMMMLLSAEILAETGELYAEGNMAIVYNNPQLKIPQKRELKEILSRSAS